MPEKRMVDLSGAHAWWAPVEDGKLRLSIFGEPVLFKTREEAQDWGPQAKSQSARVYLVVESD